MIDFDKASTSQIDLSVLTKIITYFRTNYGNPSSTHQLGMTCKKAIEDSRDIVSSYINADVGDIIFTSSSSASNALAIKGFIEKNPDFSIIVSSIEHIDILECVNYLHSSMLFNTHVNYFTVAKDGIADLDFLEIQCAYTLNIEHKRPFVILQYVNNELGTINDIKKACEIVHKYNGVIFVDATQAITKLTIDVKDLDVDMLSFGAHKIHGLRGVGVLYVKANTELAPLIFGHQEKGLYGGTENTVAIVSLGEALKLKHDCQHVQNLRNYFEDKVTTTIADTYINGNKDKRICSTTNICFKACDAKALQALLNYDEIFVSTGSACNSEVIEPSHVLKAIGLNESDIFCCLRFSFDESNTLSEANYVIDKLVQHVNMLRSLR